MQLDFIQQNSLKLFNAHYFRSLFYICLQFTTPWTSLMYTQSHQARTILTIARISFLQKLMVPPPSTTVFQILKSTWEKPYLIASSKLGRLLRSPFILLFVYIFSPNFLAMVVRVDTWKCLRAVLMGAREKCTRRVTLQFAWRIAYPF